MVLWAVLITGVRIMAVKPSEILRKSKSPEKKDDKKPTGRSAMLDFIAKHKQAADQDKGK
jgi:hypothetical protein